MELTNTPESMELILSELKKDLRLEKVYISDRDGGAVHFQIINGIGKYHSESDRRDWVQSEYFMIFKSIDHIVVDHFKIDNSRFFSRHETVSEAINYAVDSQINIPEHINKDEFNHLKEYFLLRNWHIHKINFEKSFVGFEFDNLRIYFNRKQNQWRLKNTDNNQFSMSSMLDITHITFPFDEVEQLRINQLCSDNHGIKQF